MSSKSGGAKKKADDGSRVIADNRKARHHYFVKDTIEAGIELQGSEVKSLREGQASLNEAYAQEKGGQIMLLGAHIPEYKPAGQFNHAPQRPRRLLLHKREIERLAQGVQRQGMTLVPLKLYFNARGRVKLALGLCEGKKLHDKRQTEKERSWQRDKARLMRERG